MNKSDLIRVVAEKTGLSRKDTEKALTAALEAITKALTAGEKVQLVGFGAFEVKARAARVGRNPKTGQSIQIPASSAPIFKPGKVLKEAVSK